VAAIAVLGAAAVVIIGQPSKIHSTPVRVVANSLVKLAPSGAVLSDVRVGDRPVGVAVGREGVWVVNRGDRTVSRVDLRTGRVQILGGTKFAYDVAADAHDNTWVSGGVDAVVTRITSGVGVFPTPPEPPESIRVPHYAGALAVGGGYVWVSNAGVAASGVDTAGKNTVSRIDLRSHRLVSRIPVGDFPFAIAFGYGSAWVVNSDSDSLSVVTAGSSRAQTISLPIDIEDAPLAVAVGAGSVWVVSRDGTVIRVDPDRRRVLAKIVSRTDAVESLDIAVGSGFVWVTNRADGSVSMIDPKRNRIVRTIPLGRVGVVPCGVAASSTAIWVTIGSDTDCGSSLTR
jgi:DNA-binding beta-propeller fold protein YncE